VYKGKISQIKEHHQQQPSHHNSLITQITNQPTSSFQSLTLSHQSISRIIQDPFKMQFTTFLLAVFASTATFASPIAQPDNTIEARAQQLIDLWKEPGFLDLKFTGSSDVGKCENLPKNFQNSVSSGKSKPGFRCTIWV